MSGAWRIGDALTLARELPDESVNCIVTSPPYWGLRSYLADDDPDKALEMGAEPTLAEYVERLVVLFRELRRALRSDGVAWLNLGDCYAQKPTDGLKPKDLCLVPYRVALALQDDGWFLRSHIIWHKPNPMPESVTDRPTSSHEAVFLLTKSERYWYDAEAVKEPSVIGAGALRNITPRNKGADTSRNDGDRFGVVNDGTRNLRNVWTIATRPYSGSHYAVMPPALVEPCVKAGCPPKVCAECGAPWERVVERLVSGRNGSGVPMGEMADTGVPRHRAATRAGESTSLTIGWRATCDHDGDTRPGLVLDPFGGSGTVGMVAESLGRDWLMFDLDHRNEALMRERTAQRSLLGLMG